MPAGCFSAHRLAVQAIETAERHPSARANAEPFLGSINDQIRRAGRCMLQIVTLDDGQFDTMCARVSTGSCAYLKAELQTESRRTSPPDDCGPAARPRP